MCSPIASSMASAHQDRIPTGANSSSGRQPQEMGHADDPVFISELAFGDACRMLLRRSQQVNVAGMSLRLGGEAGNQYLVITRSLPGRFPARAPDTSSNDETQGHDILSETDEDDQSAIHHFKTPVPSVEYNILFSSTYRVPVLYFFLHNLPPGSLSGLDAVYGLLVPEQSRSGLQQMGVMGGISMSNHPANDLPAYFIHPCNTADAMRNIIYSSLVSPRVYLQVWIGLVGGCVGLYLPSQLIVGNLQDD